MKKTLIIILTLLSAGSLSLALTNPHVTMRMSSDEVSETDTFTVTLGASQGDSMRTVFIRLNYDEQKVRFLEGTPGSLFQGAVFWDIHPESIETDSSTSDSMVYMVAVLLGAGRFVSAPGTFFNVSFVAIDSGRAVFTLDSLKFVHPNLSYFSGTWDSLETIISPTDTFPPNPISDFKVQEDGPGRLKLHWRDPNDEDFEGTIILRSTDTFIQTVDTTETVVYDGTDEIFTEDNLVDNTVYYYTAFAYDEIPNYSSPMFLKGVPKGEYVFTYPNPFNPDDGSGTTFNILFTNNTFVDIILYDAVGNHVIDLYKAEEVPANKPTKTMRWNGRNGDNEIVANGVYYFVVKTSQGDQKIGKVAVLR
ncbi:MAG: T9SS type A sorting domain-containing protein [Candidatus Marinimicrobia bacterium]|nr:T9SS type A sorting domain-containing protein [Candidatus Neomarinimicrobiota bacterium]